MKGDPRMVGRRNGGLPAAMTDTLGGRIQRLRMQRGMTQEDMARQSGYLRRPALALVELGHCTPKLDNFALIARALGVTMDALYWGEAAHAAD